MKKLIYFQFMKCKTHLPPISPLCDYYSNEPGSLDVMALNSQLPNKLSQSSAYDEIANLSETILNFQKENQFLRYQLFKSIDNNDDYKYPALILEHKLKKFAEHLKERDNKLMEISKFIASKPKLINLKNQTRKECKKAPIFDLFASSLLTSNDQKRFFKAPELERQNNELKEIIEKQKKEIKFIKERQSIYPQMQQKNSVSIKLDQLSQDINSDFDLLIPEQSVELDLTIQMLQTELKSLIKTRKKLADKQRVEKYNLRLYRLQYQSALTIQRVFKGFIVRKMLKEQKICKFYSKNGKKVTSE